MFIEKYHDQFEVCSHPPGTPASRIDQQLILDQYKWCLKNLKTTDWAEITWEGDNTRFRFRYEKDAVMFILRWR